VPRIIRQSYARKGATRALGPLNRPLHPLNHALHVPRLFAFEDSEFAAAGGASRYKIKLYMRSQHQMVTLAHPCHVITQCTAICFIAFFPLNRHIFIKSGHFAPHSTTLCFPQASYPKPVKTSSRDSAPETVKMHSIPAQVVIGFPSIVKFGHRKIAARQIEQIGRLAAREPSNSPFRARILQHRA
jgi:hypothetical protein